MQRKVHREKSPHKHTHNDRMKCTVVYNLCFSHAISAGCAILSLWNVLLCTRILLQIQSLSGMNATKWNWSDRNWREICAARECNWGRTVEAGETAFRRMQTLPISDDIYPRSRSWTHTHERSLYVTSNLEIGAYVFVRKTQINLNITLIILCNWLFGLLHVHRQENGTDERNAFNAMKTK